MSICPHYSAVHRGPSLMHDELYPSATRCSRQFQREQTIRAGVTTLLTRARILCMK
jgi:hypothetical protein